MSSKLYSFTKNTLALDNKKVVSSVLITGKGEKVR